MDNGQIGHVGQSVVVVVDLLSQGEKDIVPTQPLSMAITVLVTAYNIKTALFLPVIVSMITLRSNYQRCSVKKAVLKNYATFTGKHPC